MNVAGWARVLFELGCTGRTKAESTLDEIIANDMRTTKRYKLKSNSNQFGQHENG